MLTLNVYTPSGTLNSKNHLQVQVFINITQQAVYNLPRNVF